MRSQIAAKNPSKPGQPAWLRNVRRRLRAWYRSNARDLPWRKTRDPYAIWISEIMLQQTQVATVQRYFPRFLAEFPDALTLAAARESNVLRQWEGLGYYRRARQMHAAAKRIVSDHNGRFPCDFETLRQLPGIGRYTAGAILSIAFDAAQPILEANTIRLLSRLWAFRGNTHDRSGQTVLWNAAASLLSSRGNGELNQVLMELGSLICTLRKPKCESCPLALHCPTRKLGVQDRIPARRRKTPVEDLCEAAVVAQRNGSVLLRQCEAKERWAGLWDFPRFRIELNPTMARRKQSTALEEIDRQIIDSVRKLVGVSLCAAAPLRHASSHGHAIPNHAAWLRGAMQKLTRERPLRSISLGETGANRRISVECDRSEARPAVAPIVRRQCRKIGLTCSVENPTGDWLIFAQSAEQKCACPLLPAGVFKHAGLTAIAEQSIDRLADIGTRHQRFADQNRIDPRRFQPFDIGPGANAALRPKQRCQEPAPASAECDPGRS